MGCAAIDQLKELVLDDGEVRARLLRTADTQVFVSELLEVARSCGLDVSARDLDEAILGPADATGSTARPGRSGCRPSRRRQPLLGPRPRGPRSQ